jgi:hypothetical protein
MRRWFAILLLVLLPLQELKAGQDESPSQPGAAHIDCHVCHGSAAAPIVAEAIGAPKFGAKHPSISEASALPAPPLTRPERPNWQRLA